MKRTDKTGETLINNFGSTMIITKYRKHGDIDVYFPEYDWTAEHVNYANFKNGRVKCCYEPRVYNVGCVGEGKYKTWISDKKIHTKEYEAWRCMLRRCYGSKELERNKSYKDCIVCQEWLNFQNFAEWYEKNYYEIPGEVMALDKDILFKDNKTYSPDTCVFVPQKINTLFTKCDATRGDLPIGVSYDKTQKKYEARCKSKYLGRYNTPEEAFQAYKQFKEAYIKKMANDYIEDIPFNLYQAMINYEVEIDD